MPYLARISDATYVLAGSSYLTQGWQRIGMRVVGSWIGACALMVAALAMR